MRGTARFFHILFLILLLAFSTIPAQSAVAPGSQAALQVPNLEGTEDLDDDWVVLPHRETGSTRFLSTRSGNPIMQPRMLAPMATTETAARTFLDSYGYLFGLRNQADELAVMSERITTDGRSLVRFQQQHMGVPILAGEMIVNMDSVGNVRSISAEVLPDLDVETAPGISPESASQIALEFVSSEYQIESGNLQVSEPVLWIYNPALLGAPGLRMDSLVWRVEVNALNFLPVRELVLVDAHSGQISLHFNQSHETIARAVYDVNNDGTQSVSVDTLAINEGDPETGIIDVDNAYDYAGFTYDFYASRHGRDSLDDHGMPMVSVVRFCVTAGTCPLSNAWWSGTHVVFGDGFSSADDVVAHEFTHGVTEFESNLFYYMESGAINEAFSDIWGEFIDLNYSNGRDNDSPEVR
jgi:Zn-dependent metalloprotease